MGDTLEECLDELSNVLRFFAEQKNYSYIDRIANALTPSPAEKAIQEALRHLRSLYDSSFQYSDEKSGKTFRAVRINDNIVILPKMPSQKCIKEVLEAISDSSIRRKLAILSLSYGR